MKQDAQQEMKLRRYLLGELPFEEQVLVEQRLFLDREYVELQQAVIDDLIDEYLVDELRGSEREKFVNHFLLLPEHGADLRVAEALKKYLAENTPATETDTNNPHTNEPPGFLPFSFLNKPLVWLSLSVAAFIILSVSAWIAIRAMRGQGDGPQQAREPQPTQSQPDNRQQPAPVPPNDNRVETAEKGNTNGSPAQPDKPPERRSGPPHTVVTATIYAGSPTRGGGSRTKVTIYDDTKEVVLRLPLEFSESYERYRAELLSGERKIEGQSDLKSQVDNKYGPVVVVQFSADTLREQSYRIKLYGVPTDQQSAEPPVTYPFNVERK